MIFYGSEKTTDFRLSLRQVDPRSLQLKSLMIEAKLLTFILSESQV